MKENLESKQLVLLAQVGESSGNHLANLAIGLDKYLENFTPLTHSPNRGISELF